GLEVVIYGRIPTRYPRTTWYGRKCRCTEVRSELRDVLLVPTNIRATQGSIPDERA
ncbi:unnamed protein product, partial [Citrullus colocynthis]